MTAVGAAKRFYFALSLGGAAYLGLIIALLVADASFTNSTALWASLHAPEIRYAIRLSIISCLVTTVLSLWVAVPAGYVLARVHFQGKAIVDTLLDIPIVLPPLVLGLSLLILFQTPPGKWLERQTTHHMGAIVAYGVVPVLIALVAWCTLHVVFGLKRSAIPRSVALGFLVLGMLELTGQRATIQHWSQGHLATPITYAIPRVILAQFSVSCAFALRTMRVAFDQISPRTEQVALTVGCTRWQAFWLVAVPEAWRGVVSAGAIAFARALGEFGPILIFSGATRMRTEVLSTTVFLELSIGRLEAALAVSLLMVFVAMIVLLLMRFFGMNRGMV